ncbi:MAG TPA: DUF58 domain-containing protein [Myxococcales bacterium]|nr:DUF58 domain-containing protein [Myxococcales bacterium]
MSSRPGPLLPWALAGAAAVAAAGAVLRPLAFIGTGIGLLVACAAVGEMLALRRVRVRVGRDPIVAVPLGELDRIPVRFAHDSGARLRFALRTLWPAELGGGSTMVAGACGPGETAVLLQDVHGVKRGEARVEAPWAALTRFGLVERIVQAGSEQMVRVIPNLKEVHRMNARLNALFLRGLGTRLAPRTGQGREFDRLREYVTGDDYRQISWKATARQRKPIVRQFRVERSQDVLFCLDSGHRMAPRVGELTRIDHAVNAAVLAAYFCNRAEDRTGLLSFSSAVQNGVGQGRGAGHLASITRFATSVAPEYLPSDYRALAAHLCRRLRTRTLVVVFTALPERGDHGDLLEGLRLLMPRHLPLVLALEDVDLGASARVLPKDHQALCRTLVASELVHDRARLIAGLRQMGALVAETPPQESGAATVNAWLDVKRRQLL